MKTNWACQGCQGTQGSSRRGRKTLSEGVKGIFGQSSKDKQIKALRKQINALNKEIFILKSEQIGQQESATQKIDKAYQEGFSKAYEEVYKLQAQLKKPRSRQQTPKNIEQI